MAGARQKASIEDRIAKSQDKVVAAKEKYDAAVAEFKDLIAKRDALQREELMDLFVKSSRTYEEVKAFLMEGIPEGMENQPKKRGGRRRKADENE